MIAVLIFMVVFFAVMGAVTAVTDAVLVKRRRRPAQRAADPIATLRPAPWLRPPRSSTRAEELELMAEIEEWMRQQQP